MYANSCPNVLCWSQNASSCEWTWLKFMTKIVYLVKLIEVLGKALMIVRATDVELEAVKAGRTLKMVLGTLVMCGASLGADLSLAHWPAANGLSE
jgi:hypothetical protein